MILNTLLWVVFFLLELFLLAKKKKQSWNCEKKWANFFDDALIFCEKVCNTPLKIKRTGKKIEIESKNALRGLKFDT